jgi:hypothetical protein
MVVVCGRISRIKQVFGQRVKYSGAKGLVTRQVADALHKPSRDAARVAVTRALRRLAETMARAAKPEAGKVQ